MGKNCKNDFIFFLFFIFYFYIIYFIIYFIIIIIFILFLFYFTYFYSFYYYLGYISCHNYFASGHMLCVYIVYSKEHEYIGTFCFHFLVGIDILSCFCFGFIDDWNPISFCNFSGRNNCCSVNNFFLFLFFFYFYYFYFYFFLFLFFYFFYFYFLFFYYF